MNCQDGRMSETFSFLIFVCFVSRRLKYVTRKTFLTKAYSLAITSHAIIESRPNA